MVAFEKFACIPDYNRISWFYFMVASKKFVIPDSNQSDINFQAMAHEYQSSLKMLRESPAFSSWHLKPSNLEMFSISGQ